METKVIHIKNRQYTPNEIYMGRPSYWENKYVIGKDGSRYEVIEKYNEDFEHKLVNEKDFIYKVASLYGHVLVCFCSPLPCHCDIIARWANELNMIAHRYPTIDLYRYTEWRIFTRLLPTDSNMWNIFIRTKNDRIG